MEEKEGEFGDFEEVSEEGQQPVNGEMQVPTRVRVPRHGEVIGILFQRLGGNRMEVRCTDGKTRNCRVPGRFSRTLWLRPRDIVLVKPWPDNDEKGDVIFKYDGSAGNQLRKRGILDSIKTDF